MEKLARLSVEEYGISSLTEEIVRGELKPGNRISAESEMVETPGVARNSLCGAVRILCCVGVLGIRRTVREICREEKNTRCFSSGCMFFRGPALSSGGEEPRREKVARTPSGAFLPSRLNQMPEMPVVAALWRLLRRESPACTVSSGARPAFRRAQWNSSGWGLAHRACWLVIRPAQGRIRPFRWYPGTAGGRAPRPPGRRYGGAGCSGADIPRRNQRD